MAVRKRISSKKTVCNVGAKKKTRSKPAAKKSAAARGYADTLSTRSHAVPALKRKPGLRVTERNGSIITVQPVGESSQAAAGRRLLRQVLKGDIALKTPRAIDILGGERVLGVELRSQSDVIKAVRKGFPQAALDALLKHLDVTKVELAKITGIPRRTLMRKLGEEQRLSASQSDRVYRIALISALAERVLESIEASSEWLSKPNPALGDVAPLELLDTEAGAEEVRGLLNQIDAGVYA